MYVCAYSQIIELFIRNRAGGAVLGTCTHFVDDQVNQRSYGTSSEYLRELNRKDQDRLHLRTLLLAGASSAPAPAAPADATYFTGLRNRVQQHAKR